MVAAPGGILAGLVLYLIPLVILGAVLYVVVRFAIRDGLRGHQLWLERTRRIGPDGDPPATGDSGAR